MMRLTLVILMLAATAGALVHLRARQVAERARLFRLEAERVEVRRRLQDQQLRLGEATRLERISALRGNLAQDLIAPGDRETGVVCRDR